MGAMAHTSISTPFCDQVVVVGEVRPDCPRNGKVFLHSSNFIKGNILVNSVMNTYEVCGKIV